MDKVIWIYIGGFAALLILLFVKSFYDRKERKRRFYQRLQENWGRASAREYSLGEMDKLTHYFYLKEQKGFVIDEITWKDLDMDRLFRQINQTYSSIGEEYLYYLLRTPCFDERELKKRDELIQYFEQEKEERMLVQEIFGNMGRTRQVSVAGYLAQFEELTVKNPLRYYVHPLTLALSVLLLLVIPAAGIFALLFSVGWSVVSYFKEKREIESYLEAFSYISNVLSKAYLFEKVKSPFLKPYVEDIVNRADALKRFRKGRVWLKSGSDLSGGLEDVVMDYVRVLLHVDLAQFNKMLRELYTHRQELSALYEDMGYLESMISIASYRCFLKECVSGYTVPEFTKAGMRAEAVYHPLIADPVANSIDAGRGVLLTGSNASGKSTFLKTIAMNCILAQTIYTAAAQVFSMPMGRVYSSMALQDNLEGEESYFIVEIKSLKRIIDAVGEVPVICFVDEVLRGTNTVERIAASAEILDSLGADNIYCFAATHDIELTYLLEDAYDNYHFSEQIEDGKILFNYRLRKGRATSRNAISLLEIMGYQPWIIERARGRAQYFMEHNTWK